jgi:hypothetical protein
MLVYRFGATLVCSFALRAIEALGSGMLDIDW